MNLKTLTYCPNAHNANLGDTFVGPTFTGKAQRERFAEHSFYHSPSSDEGSACGFPDSKAQRERFAEYSDFSTTNTTVRDEETGFGYFGARYYDSELLTGWMSIDPMSDKYPSLSPYNYCAWTRPTGGDEHRWIKYNIVNNPVKFVDPNGDSVHVGLKNRDEGNNALLSSLKHKTGLDLYVDDRGMMRYRKSESGRPISSGGSESARNDLIQSIEDKVYHLDLHYTKDDPDISGGVSQKRIPERNVSIIWLDISDFSGEENATFDIGMVFLHEFQHGYFGLSDNVTTSVNINTSELFSSTI